MSALPLLEELTDAGIALVRDGDNLRIRADKTIDLSAFAPRIREQKPALLDALRQQEHPPEPKLLHEAESTSGENPNIISQPSTTVLRWLTSDETEAMGLDPSLVWLRVAGFGESVEATSPPAGWTGTLPECCQFPGLCSTLGPCPHVSTQCESAKKESL